MDPYSLPPAGGDLPGYNPVRWQRAATLCALAALALYFLWRVRDVLVPFIVAFFLAGVEEPFVIAPLDPLVIRLQRNGWTRARAVATIYLAVFLVIVAVLLWIAPLALNQVENLTQNADSYGQAILRQSDRWFAHYKGPLSMLHVSTNPLRDRAGPVTHAVAAALDTVKGSVLAAAGSMIWIIIIPLSLFYFLLDFQGIRARLVALAPPQYQASILKMSAEVVEIFSAYFRSLAVVCALYGITATILFSLLGLRYGLFLGIAAGVLYAVPYVGPATTTLAAAVIALTMNPVVVAHTSITVGQVPYAILVVVVYLAMHVTFDYGITPRLVGGSVGLHPLVNIFALMCGATLFNVWGMLLAVPVAASIQMLLLYFFPRLMEKPLPLPAADPAPDEEVRAEVARSQ